MQLYSRIHHTDCRLLFRGLPDRSVHLLLTDPPYGVFYRSNSHKLPLRTIANDDDEAMPLFGEMLREAYRTLTDDGILLIFSSRQCCPDMSRVLYDEGYQIDNILVWEKNGWNQGDLKGNWRNLYELIIFCRKRATPRSLRRFLNGPQEGNVLHYKKPPTNALKHPTEKPVDLLRHLIERTTLPGHVVVDPFMGCGNTIVASMRSGRIGIGGDIEQVWCDVAADNTGLPLSPIELGEVELAA